MINLSDYCANSFKKNFVEKILLQKLSISFALGRHARKFSIFSQQSDSAFL